jgi:hypothetical protein
VSRLVIAFVDDAQAKAVEKILRDVVDGIPMMGSTDDLDALAGAVRDGATVDHDAAAQVYSADVLARMVAPDLAASVEALAARADELTAECVKVRAAWASECRRSDDATARADAAEVECEALRARLAELERLRTERDAAIARAGSAEQLLSERTEEHQHTLSLLREGRELVVELVQECERLRAALDAVRAAKEGV